jgi:hypothetical protein
VFNAGALHISQIVIFSVYEHIDSVYISAVIQRFRCKETEKVWNEQYSRKLPTQIQEKGPGKTGAIGCRQHTGGSARPSWQSAGGLEG